MWVLRNFCKKFHAVCPKPVGARALPTKTEAGTYVHTNSSSTNSSSKIEFIKQEPHEAMDSGQIMIRF